MYFSYVTVVTNNGNEYKCIRENNKRKKNTL